MPWQVAHSKPRQPLKTPAHIGNRREVLPKCVTVTRDKNYARPPLCQVEFCPKKRKSGKSRSVNGNLCSAYDLMGWDKNSGTSFIYIYSGEQKTFPGQKLCVCPCACARPSSYIIYIIYSALSTHQAPSPPLSLDCTKSTSECSIHPLPAPSWQIRKSMLPLQTPSSSSIFLPLPSPFLTSPSFPYFLSGFLEFLPRFAKFLPFFILFSHMLLVLLFYSPVPFSILMALLSPFPAAF